MTDIHIFAFAGEKSGDAHGSLLLQALKRQHPRLILTGVGGPHMRSQGLSPIIPMEEFEVMGFSDVFKALPRLWSHFRTLLNYIIKTKPDQLLLIDSPAFTLRLARALRKKKYSGKIALFICPSVWAWGRHRIELMARNLDLLLTIYPFEPSYFSHTQLEVHYIGNPLLDKIEKHEYQPDWRRALGIPSDLPLVALFPGSRAGEIKRHLPLLLKTAQELRQKYPEICFAVSYAHEKVIPELNIFIEKTSLRLNRDLFLVPQSYSYDLMQGARCALAKSGTVTLELALHSCPSVVVYKLSWLNRIIAQYLLRVNLPHYCIVNILANEKVFSEHIAEKLKPSLLMHELDNILAEGPPRSSCIQGCHKVRETLNKKVPYKSMQYAAHLFLKLLNPSIVYVETSLE